MIELKEQNILFFHFFLEFTWYMTISFTIFLPPQFIIRNSVTFLITKMLCYIWYLIGWFSLHSYQPNSSWLVSIFYTRILKTFEEPNLSYTNSQNTHLSVSRYPLPLHWFFCCCSTGMITTDMIRNLFLWYRISSLTTLLQLLSLKFEWDHWNLTGMKYEA